MTSQYDERFRRFSRRVEKGIMIGIVACAIALTAGEILIQYVPARAFLIETERLEGVSDKP
ncbi:MULTISPECIES: hypothetical protein [Brevibacillus]|uniref:Uncharacterized protein n=1 Tax=Brevibacillus parabrevis TaxID=54914 RepID=A0A4Y3PGV9_BREPA|nr:MULTISPECIES: hypothetical protein [Brevibacillus]MBU8712129.1 hypothetical protein [Brevibacillus parabrevis]MED2257531.1 hypothetical protein [Brevibacillus parabrevis]NRQ52225.1 hypothetical protein [Brevibacillus sp. HD1.4A]RNB96317.1 hypothetical protein EDM60_08640 [Brevibacillus parabrevis]GEB32693.1 hypothetical protein BPA01_22730 [Brevibacillus parabrevis]